MFSQTGEETETKMRRTMAAKQKKNCKGGGLALFERWVKVWGVAGDGEGESKEHGWYGSDGRHPSHLVSSKIGSSLQIDRLSSETDQRFRL